MADFDYGAILGDAATPGAIQRALEARDRAARESIAMGRGALDQYRAALSQTSPGNMALMSAFAALGRPTTTGAMSESFSNFFDAYGKGRSEQEERNLTKAEKLSRLMQAQAQLHQQEGGLGWQGLSDRIGVAEKLAPIGTRIAEANFSRGLSGLSAAPGGLPPSGLGATPPASPAASSTAQAGPTEAAASRLQQVAQANDGSPPAAAPAPAQAAETPAQPPSLPEGSRRLSPQELSQARLLKQQYDYASRPEFATNQVAQRTSAATAARLKEIAGDDFAIDFDGGFAYPTGRASPAYQNALAEAKRKQEGLTSGDRTAIRGLEDDIRNADNTIRTLSEAKELAPKANSGAFAVQRGRLGEMLPDYALPDFISSPESGKATMRLNQILSSEAIKAMSESLKGATTNFEMQEFMRILADPSAPAERKLRAIDGIERYAQRQKEDAQISAEQIRGGNYYKPGGGPAAQRSGQANQNPSNNAIELARKAIREGAPREAVIKRLRDNGIDPAGL